MFYITETGFQLQCPLQDSSYGTTVNDRNTNSMVRNRYSKMLAFKISHSICFPYSSVCLFT